MIDIENSIVSLLNKTETLKGRAKALTPASEAANVLLY